jgi:tight adherence protein B
MAEGYYLFGIAVFVAVVLLLDGGYSWWSTNRSAQAKRLAKRLEALKGAWHGGAEQFSLFKNRMLSRNPALQRLLERIPHILALDRLLMQSGLGWEVSRFLGMTVLAAALALAAALYFHLSWRFVLAAPPCGAVLPLLYVLRAKKKRMTRLEQQLPDAVDLMARALRAGHALPTAVKMVGDEMTQPIGAEFRTLFEEVNYGISMQEGLLNLASRIPSMDVKYLVIAILIQRESGGNLAELLDNIAAIIRARLKLFGTIRVLSAEGRLSAWILGLLPFCTAALINVVNPKFLSVLWTDPVGHKMVGTLVGLMIFGVLWMRTIIRIRV